MAAAIENMRKEAAARKLLILGDMLELGEWSRDEHRRILQSALDIPDAGILLVGPRFAEAAEGNGMVKCFATTAELIEYLKANPIEGYTVLVKGSHSMALEKTLEYL